MHVLFPGFSFVSLFSITMWIHLNFGTDGLDRFLLKSVSLLDAKSGYLLIGKLSIRNIITIFGTTYI